MATATKNEHDARFIRAYMTAWEILQQGGKDPTELMITGYRRALSDMSPDDIELAFSRLIATWRYPTFPRPVDIREAVTGGRESIADRGHIESTRVVQAIKRVGAWSTVQFSDEITMAVIVHCFGGWVRVCLDLTEETEKWFMRDFAKYYGAFARSGRRESGPLMGMIDSNNSTSYPDYKSEVVMIGDNHLDWEPARGRLSVGS